MAAVVGTHTDAELRRVLEDQVRGSLCPLERLKENECERRAIEMKRSMIRRPLLS